MNFCQPLQCSSCSRCFDCHGKTTIIDGIIMKSYCGCIYEITEKHKITGFNSEYIVIEDGKLKLTNSCCTEYDLDIANCDNSSICIFTSEDSLSVVVYFKTKNLVHVSIFKNDDIRSHSKCRSIEFQMTSKPKMITSSNSNSVALLDTNNKVFVFDYYNNDINSYLGDHNCSNILVKSTQYPASHQNIIIYQPEKPYFSLTNKTRKDFIFFKTNKEFILLGIAEISYRIVAGGKRILTHHCTYLYAEFANILGYRSFSQINDSYLQALNNRVKKYFDELNTTIRIRQLGN